MSPRPRLIAVSITGLLALSLAPSTIGQAAPPVVSASSAPDGVLGSFSALGAGTSATVTAVVMADDTIYIGGTFGAVSGVAGTSSVAAWSSVDDTWHPLGTGADNFVFTLAVSSDDTLYAGGSFGAVSGVTGTSRVAAWSSVDDTWHPLGTGANTTVRALAVSSDDTLYAGGSFADASGVADTSRVAAWSDDSWSALGAGVSGDVQALAVRDDTLYAGGSFTTASGVTVNRVAAWSDDTWSALGAGVNNLVRALAVSSDGTVFAGGDFTAASGVTGTGYIAAWSDDTWSALGAGMDGPVWGITMDDTRGLVYAGGDFTATVGGAATSLNHVGVWDQGISEWVPLTYSGGNGTTSRVSSVAVDDSVVYLGGSFTNAGGVAAADHIARWTWEPPQGSNSLDTTVGASVTLTGEGFIGVPRTGGVKVGSTVATYTRDDSATITMTVPAGSFANAPITVDGVGGWGQVGVLSVPAPPAPAVPAGPPTDVAGVAGDASAFVRWAAPTSTGSFPVSTYQVMSSPSGGMCLSTTLTCEVTGLRNGTDYTFTVRALTGAGWGSWSQPSAVVTPQRPVTPSIMITGSRAEVRGKPGVVVDGSSTGLGMGAVLTVWMRFPGETSFTEGRARILVDESGEFSWERRTKKTIHVQLRTPDGSMTSNTLTIRRS
jgi:hypothetical protein